MGGGDFFFFPLRTREKGKREHTTMTFPCCEGNFFCSKKKKDMSRAFFLREGSKLKRSKGYFFLFWGIRVRYEKKVYCFLLFLFRSSGLNCPLLPPRLTGGKEGKAAKREFARWGGNSFGTTKSSRPGKESGTKGLEKHTDLN